MTRETFDPYRRLEMLSEPYSKITLIIETAGQPTEVYTYPRCSGTHHGHRGIGVAQFGLEAPASALEPRGHQDPDIDVGLSFTAKRDPDTGLVYTKETDPTAVTRR